MAGTATLKKGIDIIRGGGYGSYINTQTGVPMNAQQKSFQRMMAGAAAYARADKSDPFAFARAKAHILNGVATPAEREGKPAY